MKNILILTDHYGYTFTSLKNDVNKSINTNKLKICLEKRGYHVRIESLHSIPDNCKTEGTFVFYPSSEVSGLFYKEYIEDVLLDLQYRGLVLLPRFELFRAHHNKVFMEMIRDSLWNESLKTIKSYSVYGVEDLNNMFSVIEHCLGYPMVLKMSSGSGARGVALANTPRELKVKVRKMTSVIYKNYSTPWYSGVMLSKIKSRIKQVMGKKVNKITYPQEKVIIQNFISNLHYDYKVLVFGNKYYTLKRLTRKNDFRASGSGKFIFPESITPEIESILSMAKALYEELCVPILSVDIAYDGKKSHVIEFQCVSFGPYTLQFSPMYFKQDTNGKWISVRKKSTLEDEIGNALNRFIQRIEVSHL